MRVVAFWAAIAGLVLFAGRAIVMALSLSGAGGEDGAALKAAGQVATFSELAFILLLVILLFIIAVSGRKT